MPSHVEILSALESSGDQWQFQSRVGSHQYLRLYELTRRYVTPGSSVLDWGAASGHFSYFLQSSGYRATGFSLYEEHVPKALLGDGYRLVLGDPSDPVTLPFADDSFDAVASIGVLEHVRETGGDEEASLREIGRVLRRGGVLPLLPSTESLQLDQCGRSREPPRRWSPLSVHAPRHRRPCVRRSSRAARCWSIRAVTAESDARTAPGQACAIGTVRRRLRRRRRRPWSTRAMDLHELLLRCACSLTQSLSSRRLRDFRLCSLLPSKRVTAAFRARDCEARERQASAARKPYADRPRKGLGNRDSRRRGRSSSPAFGQRRLRRVGGARCRGERR